MGLKFHWSIYFFFPPILLARAAGMLVVPLAIIVAAAWLWFGWRRLDVLLLAVAFVAAIGVTWLVNNESTALAAADRMILFGCAHFIWFAAILLPVRWLVARFLLVE
ncbi:MAG: hypothetical protein KIT36_01675 [Alphaproteobacteria bacterium]|nr:hypothetical protein [Alphaproteobacteria bacterium]